MNKLTAVLLPFLLCSCAATTLDQKSAAYVNSRPHISADLRAAILEHRLLKGMTFDHAEASWGKPSYKHRETSDSGVEEIWEYKWIGQPDKEILFKNGVLDSWKIVERSSEQSPV